MYFKILLKKQRGKKSSFPVFFILSFLKIAIFIGYHFPSVWRTLAFLVLQICCQLIVLGIYFKMSTVFISPLFLKDFFCWIYKFWIEFFLLLAFWRCSLSSGLWWDRCQTLSESLFACMQCDNFQHFLFLLYLVFISLAMNYLGMITFVFILLEVCWTSDWIYIFMTFTKFGKNLDIILSKIF